MIRTPDQRLRVFVSSTLQELAPERAAVRASCSARARSLRFASAASTPALASVRAAVAVSRASRATASSVLRTTLWSMVVVAGLVLVQALQLKGTVMD